jgi:hypothetical protein
VVAVVYLCVSAVLLLGLGRRGADRRAWLRLTGIDRRALGFGAALWVGAYAAAFILYTVTAPLGLSPADATAVLWGVGSDNGRLSDASPIFMALILVRVCLLVPLRKSCCSAARSTAGSAPV